MKAFGVVLLAFVSIVLVAWALLPAISAPPFWALLLLALFCLYWLPLTNSMLGIGGEVLASVRTRFFIAYVCAHFKSFQYAANSGVP